MDLLKPSTHEATRAVEEHLDRDGERLFPESFAASGSNGNVAVESMSVRVDRDS